MAHVDLLSRLEDIGDAIAEAENFTLSGEFARAPGRRALHRDRVRGLAPHPGEAQGGHPEVPWRNIAGIGNVLRHGYRLADHGIIWSVVRDDLPALRVVVDAMRRAIEGKDGE
jgi:uncharacterized protein with HEPN domain